MKLTLFIKGTPFSKQSSKHSVINGHIHSYQPERIVSGEQSVRMQVISQLPKGFKPYDSGVIVSMLHYRFPIPKSFSKTKIQAIKEGALIYKTTKPDLTDNLNKGLFDAMEGIVYINDSQICSIDNAKKYYAEIPGIYIEMEGD